MDPIVGVLSKTAFKCGFGISTMDPGLLPVYSARAILSHLFKFF
jgi:hypothetical protein